MSEMDVFIEQLVLDIGTQAYQLDVLRLQSFLDWLTAHSVEMNVFMRNNSDQERFKTALKTWLQSLPVPSLLWEYKTISAEIAWWRDLDPRRLDMILASKAGS